MERSTVDSFRKALAESQPALAARHQNLGDLESNGARRRKIRAAWNAYVDLVIKTARIEEQLRAAVAKEEVSSPMCKAMWEAHSAMREAYSAMREAHSVIREAYSAIREAYSVKEEAFEAYLAKKEAYLAKKEAYLAKKEAYEAKYKAKVEACIAPTVYYTRMMTRTVRVVKDEKIGTCYQADHLPKDFCNERLQEDSSISAAFSAEVNPVLDTLDDLSDKLGTKIKEYGITAPDTKNPPSDPYLVNLVCSPGLLSGRMQPETAKGFFVRSESQYNYSSPTLCAVMSNVFMLQCKKFALEENMMEVARSCATLDIANKDYSGGHLNRSLYGLPGHNLSSLYQRATVVESVCCSNSGLHAKPSGGNLDTFFKGLGLGFTLGFCAVLSSRRSSSVLMNAKLGFKGTL